MSETLRVSGLVAGAAHTRWRSRVTDESGAPDGDPDDPQRGIVRRWLRGGGTAADLAPVVAVTCLALPPLIHHARFSDPRLSLYVVLTVLLIGPLTVRRRFPLTVLALVAGSMLAQAWVGIQLIAGASLLIAVYAVASRYPMPVAGPSGILAVAAAVPAALLDSRGFGQADVVVIVSAFVLAALMCGAYVRNRADTIRALTEVAAKLARERDQHAQLVAARERAQIAREMHDIIAHSLSVMVTLADAAALKVPVHPREAGATMARVSEVGRQALGDSRRVLGVLRGDATRPLTPQPGLADLDVLVEQVRHDGLDVTLTVTGPTDTVPAAVGLAVYRIAQEATTNTLKHARGAGHVHVDVTITRTRVTVGVLDDGRPGAAVPDGRPRAGHGVHGMRERAKAYGGTLIAGPAPRGGWAVEATLPLTVRTHDERGRR
jgi:signal transduction histidine kinase